MTSTITAWVLHVAGLASFYNSFRLLYLPSPINDEMGSRFGGRFTFLTILGLAVSTAYFAVALVLDVFPRFTLAHITKRGLGVLVIPAEGIISLLYWSLYLIDPRLLVPDGYGIPLSLDLSLHLIPTLFLWTDFIAYEKRFSQKRGSFLFSATAVTLYCLWMEYAAQVNQFFPYPFLDDLTLTQRILFYSAMVPVFSGLSYFANAVHLLVHQAFKTRSD